MSEILLMDNFFVWSLKVYKDDKKLMKCLNLVIFVNLCSFNILRLIKLQ